MISEGDIFILSRSVDIATAGMISLQDLKQTNILVQIIFLFFIFPMMMQNLYRVA